MANNCACPNKKCKRHGNCEACRKNHSNKNMYCQFPPKSLRKRLMDWIFRASK